jgi:hypothetical protein
MKQTIKKSGEIGHLSGFTKSGKLIYSRLELRENPDDPRNPFQVLTTAERSDAIKVLKFLDEMNGIGWTAELRKIELALRAELHDFMGGCL